MLYRTLLLCLALLCGSQLVAQVRLRLSDEAAEPLAGVNVYTTDLSFSTSSDLDGLVVIDGVSDTARLLFSYTGYETLVLPFLELRKSVAKAPRGRLFTLSLKPAARQLSEATVVGRRNDRPEEMPWTVTSVSAADIQRVNPQTSADALEASGEVYVQRSQMGGGSPVIRGFEANRVLLVLDGVRLNNAIYREGHLQNSITVDPAMLERAEVIFGAGSLHYGSDALGGVVHYRTKEPRLGQQGEPRSGGNYFVRFASANLEKTVHADHHFARRKWGTQTSVTVSSFADLKAGTRYNHEFTDFGKMPYYVQHKSDGAVLVNPDPSLQRGTGYDQVDLLQKVKLQLTDDRYVMANVQFSNSSDIPRFDQLSQVNGDRPSDLKFAEWYYGPQQRLFASLRSVNNGRSLFHDRGQWIASFQRLDEDRYERKLDNLWRDFSFVDIAVYGLTFDADKGFGASRQHTVSYGVEGQHNVVGSLGGRVRITDEAVLLDRISRYPSGGSEMTSAGAYVTYQFRTTNDRLHLQAGARYTQVTLSSKFGRPGVEEPVDWPQALRDGISGTNDALTYAGGATYRLTASTRVQALASTAFRAPNVDDFGKMRIKNGFVLVPNIDLAPEEALNAELTLTQNLGELGGTGFAGRLSVTVFASDLSRVVVRANGALPNGDTTFTSGETVYRVQVNTNADRGEVRGIGAKADFSYGAHWTLAARTTVTRGLAVDAVGEETPLSHIPPLYGQAVLRYAKARWTAGATTRFNGWKRWEDYAPAGSSDNEDLAIPEVGTPAWTVVDVDAALISFRQNCRCRRRRAMSGDLYYRPFSSGVGAPGRSFVVGVRGSF